MHLPLIGYCVLIVLPQYAFHLRSGPYLKLYRTLCTPCSASCTVESVQIQGTDQFFFDIRAYLHYRNMVQLEFVPAKEAPIESNVHSYWNSLTLYW